MPWFQTIALISSKDNTSKYSSKINNFKLPTMQAHSAFTRDTIWEVSSRRPVKH